jgi:hypothetical protein
VQSTLAKLSLCRTRALGGQTYQCDACGEVSEVWHSCGDRHCPQCSGRKRYDFADRAEHLILESVTYYQVVFTLPGELSELALANRLEMADLLFAAAWKSLRKTLREQQDYDPAAMMVLHTWNQRLEPHWHVHALVPGSGPSLSGHDWKRAEAPAGAVNSDGYYLVDAISLRTSFRRHALAHLNRLRRRGKLKLGGKFAYLQDDAAWKTFCEKLAATQWVSFIQPPPTASCSAEQVVRYLTRYLTGGPISDGRIVAADAQEVTFLAREGKRTGGEREQIPVTLTTTEFIRRWCEHIQPNQLTKTRYFGGWSSQNRTAYVARCQQLLGQAEPASDHQALSADEATFAVKDLSRGEPSAEEGLPRCPHCEEPALRLLSESPKPSWSVLLSHLDPRCPQWYAELDYQEHCRYLMDEHGIEYEDWYLETQVESAMERPRFTPPIQLYLPGLYPVRDFAIESF